MAVHQNLNGKSPMELLMGRRSRPKLQHSPKCSPEYRIGIQRTLDELEVPQGKLGLRVEVEGKNIFM